MLKPQGPNHLRATPLGHLSGRGVGAEDTPEFPGSSSPLQLFLPRIGSPSQISQGTIFLVTLSRRLKLAQEGKTQITLKQAIFS